MRKKRRIINLTVQASRFAIFPLFIFSCSFLLFLYVYNVLPSSRSIYQTFSPSSILFHVHIHIFLYFTFYLLFFHHHRHHHLSSTQAVRRIKKKCGIWRSWKWTLTKWIRIRRDGRRKICDGKVMLLTNSHFFTYTSMFLAYVAMASNVKVDGGERKEIVLWILDDNAKSSMWDE